MISGTALVLGTGFFLWISRRSLGQPRSHGFSRFFAFEAILCLVVLNAPHWFEHPVAAWQLLSWLLLTIGAWLAIHGFWLLHRLGGPSAPAAGSHLYRFEHTASLVTSGPYRYIRHPMYASLLLAAWGVVLKAPSSLSVALGLLATVLLIATAKAEEAENLVRFGGAYRDYIARTRLFIPFVF